MESNILRINYLIYYFLEILLIFVIGLLWGVDGKIKSFPYIFIGLTVLFVIFSIGKMKSIMKDKRVSSKLIWSGVILMGFLFHGIYFFKIFSNTPFCMVCP